MARDRDLEDLVRGALLARLPRGTQLDEKPMFGAIGFMLNGNLVAGASDRGLMLRVGKDHAAEALNLPGTGPMEMSGRTMDAYVRADETAYGDPDTLCRLADLAAGFTAGLPPK